MIRFLLLLYPRRFREEYGAEMQRLFEERLGESRAWWRLWAELILDTLRNAPAERWRGWVSWRRVRDLYEILPREDGISRKAMLFAYYHAQAEGAAEISTEHLVTGLLRADRRWARERLGDHLEEVLAARAVKHAPTAPLDDRGFPLTKECRKMLARAREGGRLTRDGVLRAAGFV
jgi:hypothetical protein